MRDCAVLLLVAAGCAGPAGTALVDLPELRVVTAPASRGSPVVLEVVNTTRSVVTFEAVACQARLEWLAGGTWRAVPAEEGECSGLDLTLGVGDRHPFSVATPTDHGGRFRAVVEGVQDGAPFVVRSNPFLVE